MPPREARSHPTDWLVADGCGYRYWRTRWQDQWAIGIGAFLPPAELPAADWSDGMRLRSNAVPAFLLVPSEAAAPVDSLWVLSWLLVAAIGLAPILVYWLGAVIVQAARRREAFTKGQEPDRRRSIVGEQTQQRAQPRVARKAIWRFSRNGRIDRWRI